MVFMPSLNQVVNQISTEPLMEPIGYSTLWSKPEVNYLTNGASFSAICLMFGERLSDDFQEVGVDMPIGLVGSSWGGTIIEAWTPPEVGRTFLFKLSVVSTRRINKMI